MLKFSAIKLLLKDYRDIWRNRFGSHFQTAVRGEGAKSGLRKVKPWKSSWLMAASTSGSEGVSADGAAVKKLSKFSPFLPP